MGWAKNYDAEYITLTRPLHARVVTLDRGIETHPTAAVLLRRTSPAGCGMRMTSAWSSPPTPSPEGR